MAIVANKRTMEARTGWMEDGGEALLVPAAELIVDALEPFHEGTRVLEVGVGDGVLASQLDGRAQEAGARLVCVSPREQAAPEGTLAVIADPRALPFDDDIFEHATANLLLGRRSTDQAVLAELHRVLRPYGRLTATFLLDGSFVELLDLLSEACESEELHELGAALRAGRAEQLDVVAGRDLIAQAGFEVTGSGICEHALLFEDGPSAVASAMVRGGFLQALVPTGEPTPEVPPRALARLRDAIDTYFGEDGLTVTARIAVVRCEVQAKDPQFSAVLAPPEGA